MTNSLLKIYKISSSFLLQFILITDHQIFHYEPQFCWQNRPLDISNLIESVQVVLNERAVGRSVGALLPGAAIILPHFPTKKVKKIIEKKLTTKKMKWTCKNNQNVYTTNF